MCSSSPPKPIPPAPPAPPPPEAPVLAIDTDAKKKAGGAAATTGRASLRIDRTASNLGGGAGGLNIPQ